MKKTILSMAFTMTLILTMTTLCYLPASAASGNYWISGYGGGMGRKEKQLRAAYNGYRLKVSGYAKKSQSPAASTPAQKLSTRSFTVSKSCHVGAGGCEMKYSRFLKEEGKKGRLDTFINIHVKNNKVVYIDYGC